MDIGFCEDIKFLSVEIYNIYVLNFMATYIELYLTLHCYNYVPILKSSILRSTYTYNIFFFRFSHLLSSYFLQFI